MLDAVLTAWDGVPAEARDGWIAKWRELGEAGVANDAWFMLTVADLLEKKK